MKIDKRIIKCIIAVLIVFVAMVPVCGSVALAQQPHVGKLIVTVYNRANCSNSVVDPYPKCPAFYNMMTGVEIGTEKVPPFPAGPCEFSGAVAGSCVGPTREFNININQPFAIEAKMGSQAVCGKPPMGSHEKPSIGSGCTWQFQTPHIVSSPRASGGCGDVYANRCEGVMPDIQVLNIAVNYHWKPLG